MKGVLVLLLLLLLPAEVFATAQITDLILYQGEEQMLFSEPLESYFDREHPRPEHLFDFSCTGSWRGYKASWEIRDMYLYLNKIVEGTCDPDAREIELSRIFQGHKKPVKATWFSGYLRIPQGAPIYYEHMGYESLYERDLFLELRNGEVVSERIVDNTKRRKSRDQLLDELEDRARRKIQPDK